MTRSAPPPHHLLTSLPSMALMPILISTNLDSRCLICHDSIATIDISLPPFDPPSSNCPISIPTLSIGGDKATLPLTSGHHGVTWWPTIGPEVTCSALCFDYVSGIMSGECLVPFVFPFLFHIVTCEGREGNLVWRQRWLAFPSVQRSKHLAGAGTHDVPAACRFLALET